ncbi:replicative DNA helicase [Pseudooceanicola atlanticus]|uniref:replicative DNA helicase n=1 Tax=Pseudooceanicola atlanticus TaxID=1461694 RepID=UPI00235775D5|nr:DnaB-like helicase C-terminal domain-containing protein [Pseudooceanicola atlanticus]
MSNVTQFNPTGQTEEENVPQSVEAEQQLLGALMIDGDRLGAVRPILAADDFYEPLHGRIFDVMVEKYDREELISPVTVKAVMGADDGFREIGGGAYLARMAGASIAGHQVTHYAKLIRDCAARREGIAMLTAARDALTAGAKATGDIMADLESSIIDMQPADTKLRPVSMLAAATSALEHINAAYNGEEVSSIVAPFDALYRIMPRFYAGDMIVLGGRPSMGKTAVALSVATASARNGHPVVIASREMMAKALAMRAIAETTSENGRAVAYKDMASGSLNEASFRNVIEAAKSMESLPIQILPPEFRSVSGITAGAKAALKTMGDMGGKTPLIVIDYMQLLDGKGRDLREQMTDVSKKMKHLAMSTKSVVLCLSQLSRACENRENKRPMLSDLRETGQIEQDADSVLFCYRDEYYLERERPDENNMDAVADWQQRMQQAHNRLEVIVAKNRSGPIGTARLHAALEYNRIWETGA